MHNNSCGLKNARGHFIKTRKLRRPESKEEEEDIVSALSQQQLALDDAISEINECITEEQDNLHYNIINQHRDADNRSVNKEGKWDKEKKNSKV